MNAIMKSIIAAGIVASFSLNASADETPAKGPEAIHQEMRNLTQEQRAEKRKEFQKKSPEERAAMRKEMRKHLENMPPEERAKMKEEMGKKRDGMTPGQRAEKRKKMREEFQKKSPEEQKAMRKHLENMPPEERTKMRGGMPRKTDMPPLIVNPPGSKPNDETSPDQK